MMPSFNTQKVLYTNQVVGHYPLLQEKIVLIQMHGFGIKKKMVDFRPNGLQFHKLLLYVCRELICCRCNREKGCKDRCKYKKSSLKCIALWKCGGDCNDVDMKCYIFDVVLHSWPFIHNFWTLYFWKSKLCKPVSKKCILKKNFCG